MEPIKTEASPKQTNSYPTSKKIETVVKVDELGKTVIIDEKEKYADCEGPNSMYIKLISSDGHAFVVKREHAFASSTLKAMLTGPGECKEKETNEVRFREIASCVLQKVCQYFAYKAAYTNCTTEIPSFPIEAKLALEVLMAANFLDC